MAQTIQQTARFSVPPEVLFDIYLDSTKHSDAINSKASVSRRVGGKFSAFHGMLRGRNLAIVPKRLIVQAWRGSDWRRTDLDSILILTFSKARGAGRSASCTPTFPTTPSPASDAAGPSITGNLGRGI